MRCQNRRFVAYYEQGKSLHSTRKPFSGCLNIALAFRQPEKQ